MTTIPFRITDSYQVQEVIGHSRGGRPCVRLVAAIEYRVGHADSDEVIIAPVGFETEFASVPWGLWNIFPPNGPWARAAIVHDLLYQTEGDGVYDGTRWITRDRAYKRKEADDIFLEAMGVVGVDWTRRSLMYRAVRTFGWRGWGS